MAISASATAEETSKGSRIDRILNAREGVYQPANTSFGGVVLIAEGDRIVYQKAIGLADISWNIPNTVDTRFMIGSVTKTFISAITLKMVQQGKLRLDEPIVSFLDFNDDAAEGVNVVHLLKHTAGLPQLGDLMDGPVVGDFFRRPYDVGELQTDILQMMNRHVPKFTPGSSFQYNSLNYVVMGFILEKVSGQSLEKLINDFTAEIGLNNTGYHAQDVVINELATSYRISRDEADQGTSKTAPYRDRSNASASGGMYSTAEDLFRWARMLKETQLLAAELSDLMWSGEAQSYAMGWWLNDKRLGECNDKYKIISHAGAIEGFRANLTILPEADMTIINLSNYSPMATQGFSCALLQAWLGD